MSWNDIPDWALRQTERILTRVREKDLETFHHCMRVGQAARLLAEAAGLNEYESKVVEFAGLFHDVGKSQIPDEILLKPSKLTEDEYQVMKSHPELSVQMIEHLFYLPFFRDLKPGVLHHHERVDGVGYPHNMSGDQIPLAARIILIVDTFDAMTANRAYRTGLPSEVAFKELKTYSGRQFDPKLVEIFLKAKPLWADRERELAREFSNTVIKAA